VNATPFLFSQVIRCNTEKTLSVICLFERLIEIEHSASAAYQEFSAWTSSDGSAIFTYLKLYACRHNSLLKSSEVGKIIIGLGKQDFWSGTYERTLLESLSKRWDGLSQTTKKRLETKLLEGLCSISINLSNKKINRVTCPAMVAT
jgi:hypothetical protein